MSTARIQEELATQKQTPASNPTLQESTPLIPQSPYTDFFTDNTNNTTYCGYPERTVVPIACAAGCTCLVCLAGCAFSYLSGSVLTYGCMADNFQTLCGTCPEPVTSIFNPCNPSYPLRDLIFGCIWGVFSIATGYVANDTWKTVFVYYSDLYETDNEAESNNAPPQTSPRIYHAVGG